MITRAHTLSNPEPDSFSYHRRTHYNVALPSMLRSSKLPLFCMFFAQNVVLGNF